jgi:hypothetical protein
VSEELIQRLGASINFINERQHSEKQFFLNGPYYRNSSYPKTFQDGLAVFEFDAEIIDVWLFNAVAGSAGTTEIDLKISTAPGNPFATIFSTTPKITSAAVGPVWVGAPGGAYVAPAGTTAPVLSTTSVSAWTAIRIDLLSAMDDAENCGVIVHYRPTST